MRARGDNGNITLSFFSPQPPRAQLASAEERDPTIKFTAGIYVKEISFLDTCVYKDEIFEREHVLDLRTYIITDREIPIYALQLHQES